MLLVRSVMRIITNLPQEKGLYLISSVYCNLPNCLPVVKELFKYVSLAVAYKAVL